MATQAVRAQVAAKWQDTFSRMNRGQPGITGLLSMSQARAPLTIDSVQVLSLCYRRGIRLQHSCIPETYLHLRREPYRVRTAT
jgi:hypothetical protein